MIVHHVVEVATNTPVNPVYFYLGSEKFVLAFVGFVWDDHNQEWYHHEM